MRAAVLYGAGAAMGFTPQQVDAMSVWQFNAVVAGYVKANSVDDDKKLSEAEKATLFDWIDADLRPSLRTSVIYEWDGSRLREAQRVLFLG